MQKKYKVEIENVTNEVLEKLRSANVDFVLYEINEGRKYSDVFACTPNFKTTEVILKTVNEIDEKEYTEQELANHCGKLQKKMGYEMTKVVKLDQEV